MRTAYRKEVLTTGEVARICHVAPRTVSKWFDSGQLRGYRIPGSRDRRIPLPQLVAFMRAHGMPLDALEDGACLIMIVGRSVPQQTVDALRDRDHCEIRRASNGFEAGVLAQQFRPHVVILDVDAEPDDAHVICQNIRENPELQTARIIAATEVFTEEHRRRLLKQGYDECLRRPLSPTDLLAAIEEAANLIQ